MVGAEFEFDYSEVNEGIKKLIKNSNELSRLILGYTGEEVVNNSVKNYLSGQVLKRRTGKLAQSMRWKFVNDWKVLVGTHLPYGPTHEFGLTLTRNGKSWKMPLRPFVKPSIEDIMYGPMNKRIIDKSVKEFVKDYWDITL